MGFLLRIALVWLGTTGCDWLLWSWFVTPALGLSVPPFHMLMGLSLFISVFLFSTPQVDTYLAGKNQSLAVYIAEQKLRQKALAGIYATTMVLASIIHFLVPYFL